MIYNPLLTDYKSITGAVPNNKNVKFRVKGSFDSVIFVIYKDNEDVCYYPMQKEGEFFSYELSFSVGLYFYYFKVGDKFISLSNNYLGEISGEIKPFQLSVYDSEYKVPSTINGGIIYQIFPDRFNSSGEVKIDSGRVFHKDKNELPIYSACEDGEVKNNDFYGGNLKGIIEKLDYLESLSVSAIYLNPIFKAYSNHRYDTDDYMQIDSMLGTEDDLILLINEAKKRNIKIILDGVFNHTGADSIYFNKNNNYNSVGAYQDRNSPYIDWYDFTDYPKYNSWWGIKTLPAVNKGENSPFIDFICGKNGVLEHYTKLGIGGWRLDVVDELPSHFVKKIRKAVKSVNENAIIIGEVWEDASNKISYGKRRKYFCGDELDSVMNYPLKNAILSFVLGGNAKALSYLIKEQIDHYPKKVLSSLMNILSTHDTFRLISALSGVKTDGKSKDEMAKITLSKSEYEFARELVKVATLLQFTLLGVPSIYYGDEIGMQGFLDPLNRCYFSWDNIDEEILSHYKKLAVLRKNYSAFSGGDFVEIYSSDGVFIYKIVDENSEVMVAINLSDSDLVLNFKGEVKEYFSSKSFLDGATLKGKTFAVFTNE